jgi:hypothetical protein
LEVQRLGAGVVGLSRQPQALSGALSTFGGARQDTNRSRKLSCRVCSPQRRLNFDIVSASRPHFCENATHAPDGCWPFSTRIDQKKPRPTEGRRPGLLRPLALPRTGGRGMGIGLGTKINRGTVKRFPAKEVKAGVANALTTTTRLPVGGQRKGRQSHTRTRPARNRVVNFAQTYRVRRSSIAALRSAT